jgi:putative endonuclease
MNTNKITGNKGEEIAAAFLQRKGFIILAKNWRFRHWEVDIIASGNGILHFIEVKTRHSLRYGHPEESITREKMNHLKSASTIYHYQHPEWKRIQFDVIAITLVRDEVKEIFMIEDVYF